LIFSSRMCSQSRWSGVQPRDLLVGLDNIRQLKGLQGSLPIKKLEIW